MRLRRQGIDPETRETFQPRLWLAVIGLVLIGAYVVAFIAENHKRVTVHFVLFSARTSRSAIRRSKKRNSRITTVSGPPRKTPPSSRA